MKTCIGIDMTVSARYRATATLQNTARIGEWLTLRLSHADGAELALHMTRAQAEHMAETLLQPLDTREGRTAAEGGFASIYQRETDGTYSLIAVNVVDTEERVQAAILFHGPGVYRVHSWRGGKVIKTRLIENPTTSA